MAAPTIGRRRGWAPKNGAVDWSHPLATGLKSLVLPADLVDLVGPRKVTAVGTPSVVATPYGRGMSFNGTTDCINIGRPLATAHAWSLMGVFRITTTVNGYGPAIIGERYNPGNATIAYALGIGIDANPSPSILQAAYFPSWTNVDGPSLTVGRWYNAIGTYTINVANGFNLYLDGLRVGSISSSSAPVADEDTFIGRRHDNTAGAEFFPGDIAVTGIWDRALSANEVAALYADPFAMLRY